jgi:hypothetical protein
MIESLRESAWSVWYRLKGSVAFVRHRVASIPATVWVPLFASVVGAVSAFAMVWLIRLYRQETRPVHDVD